MVHLSLLNMSKYLVCLNAQVKNLGQKLKNVLMQEKCVCFWLWEHKVTTNINSTLKIMKILGGSNCELNSVFNIKLPASSVMEEEDATENDISDGSRCN